MTMKIAEYLNDNDIAWSCLPMKVLNFKTETDLKKNVKSFRKMTSRGQAKIFSFGDAIIILKK